MITRKRLLITGCLLPLLLVAVVGCRSFEQQNAALRALLPSRQGFRWVYSGFAEYGHAMELTSVVTENGKSLYTVDGLVDDPSGGEAPGPFDFSLSYQIEQGRLIQTLSAGSRLLDNKFLQLELIHAPLEQGTTWEQSVQDAAGKQYNLTGTIVDIVPEEDGTVYRVRYEDAANGYWEERSIKEGVGVVSVELPFEDFTIGYYLYAAASGYPEQR